MPKVKHKGKGKEIRELEDFAKELGFTLSRTKHDQYAFRQPGCKPVFVSYTPSDYRAYKNARADLKRAKEQSKCSI